MMTKKVMTKKFMEETGADKRTAMDYLRKSQWNYGQAKLMWYFPDVIDDVVAKIRSFDWTSLFAQLAQAIEECAIVLSEALRSIDWEEVNKKLLEEKRKEGDQK